MRWQASDQSNCIGHYSRRQDGLLVPRAWWSPGSFDSTADAFITLFKVGSLKWLSILNDGISITAIGTQPCSAQDELAGLCSRAYLHTATIYFTVFIVCGNYFCVNLLVAVIIDAFFSTENHDASDNSYIEWHAMKRLIIKVRQGASPPSSPTAPWLHPLHLAPSWGESTPNYHGARAHPTVPCRKANPNLRACARGREGALVCPGAG